MIRATQAPLLFRPVEARPVQVRPVADVRPAVLVQEQVEQGQDDTEEDVQGNLA